MATLSSWFRWLEDEDVTIGNPAARIRRPQRHSRPQPWLNRNELTDLLTAAEDDGVTPTRWCACSDSTGCACPKPATSASPILAGLATKPTLRILGKGDKPAEMVLNPRTQQALDQAVADRAAGPLRDMQRAA